MAKLPVQIVNAPTADVDALIAFLRQEGHEAIRSEELELSEAEGIGEVIVVVLAGAASALTIGRQVETWIREYYARRHARPPGVRLLGPDGKPLER